MLAEQNYGFTTLFAKPQSNNKVTLDDEQKTAKTTRGLRRRDKQRNVDLGNKSNQDNTVDKIRKYHKIQNIRSPKLTTQQQPHGKREIDRPR